MGDGSEVTQLAHRICQTAAVSEREESSSVRILHVASQTQSYHLQQAMLLAQVYLETQTPAVQQVLVT